MPLCNRSNPTGAANELALTRTCDLAVVVQQVKYAQQTLRLEQCCNGLLEIQMALLLRSERERRRVQMAVSPRVPAQRAEQRPSTAGAGLSDDTGYQGQRARECGLCGEREPLANLGMREEARATIRNVHDRRAAERGADESGRLGHDHEARDLRARDLETGCGQVRDRNGLFPSDIETCQAGEGP